MSARSALDKNARTTVRGSLWRSREKRSAAGAGTNVLADTAVLLQRAACFRNVRNDLGGQGVGIGSPMATTSFGPIAQTRRKWIGNPDWSDFQLVPS